jgi:beta-phosphoglucomutase
MIKACIFNLEGVILDTQPFFVAALEQFAPRYGWQLTTEWDEYDHLYGAFRLAAIQQLFKEANKTLDSQQLTAVMEEIDHWMEREMAEVTPDHVLDGVVNFIKELKHKGLTLGIVSPYPNTRKLLNRLQLTHLFHAVTETTASSWTPIPVSVYEKAAQELGMRPDQTIVFEHSKDNAAVLDDFFVVGVGKADDLQDESDLVIPNFESQRFLKILSVLSAG